MHTLIAVAFLMFGFLLRANCCITFVCWALNHWLRPRFR